ncbi:MAG: hypothetical protein HY549_09810 [Elusimicrobia bacterium]|nr:hypothetical protein [Elusimicrobiota bacterium]
MRRAGRSKYSREDIERAMAKIQAGQSLSDIARDMGMSKAGLSYRLSRLSATASVSGPLDSKRWQGAFAQACWKNLSNVNRKLAQKMDEASFSELVRLFESLSEVMLKLGPNVQLQIQAKVRPEMESTSETRRMVEQFLRKQDEKSGLGGPPLEQEKKQGGDDA